jgi:hypothetical protein
MEQGAAKQYNLKYGIAKLSVVSGLLPRATKNMTDSTQNTSAPANDAH